MNKKLLTLAVAAAMVAPGAAMAEAVLYGKLNVSLDYAEVKNVIPPTFAIEDGTLVPTAPGVDFEGWGMSRSGYIPGESRANRIGVKGSEDLGNGLKAIYQVELGINLNDTNGNVLSNSDSITYRNTFVGLASDWGTLLLGRHDTPMKMSTGKLDLFADTMADYNGTVGFRDLRADNVVAYISPSLAGFQLSGAIIPAGGATGGGNGLNLFEDSIGETFSVGAIYSNGPFYASAAYENLNNQHFNSQDASLVGNNCPAELFNEDGTPTAFPAPNVGCAYQSSDIEAYRFGLGLLDWAGFTLTGVYEKQDQFNNDRYVGRRDASAADSYFLPAPKEADMWQIQAGYSFGNSMIKAMYGQADYSGDDIIAGGNYISVNGGAPFFARTAQAIDYTVETWAIGFDHNLSKRTKAYALYTVKDNDLKDIVPASEWSGFSLGVMHSF
jgi:predicted porin